MRSFALTEGAIRFDERLLSVASTCLSIGAFVVSILSAYIRRSGRQTIEAENTHNLNVQGRINGHIRSFGGYTVFAFMTTRFAGAALLAYLSMIIPVNGCQSIPWLGQGIVCLESALSVTACYCSTLAFVSLLLKTWERALTFHVTLLSLVSLGIYTYRDLWPIATYDLQPADLSEGNILWTKIALLFVIAVIIPLLIPNRYVPVDPKNPMIVLDPQQTASWLSRRTYTYIDAIIAAAYKVSHLKVDQLPPLPDTEYAAYQCGTSFTHLDPYLSAKRRHLFFGLLYHFRWEYFVIALNLIGTAITTFSGPIALKQILGYIETEGQGATIKPWFWIGLLLCGPLLTSVFLHWNLYLSTVVLVRLQTVLTQLVFDHSLRIRLKAEAPSSSPSSQVSEPLSSSPTTLSPNIDEDRESIREETESQTTRQTTTVAASESSSQHDESLADASKSKKKAGDVIQAPVEPSPKHGGDAENMIGRINNLVTSDVYNVGEGNEFLNLFLVVPMQITLSIVFLYQVLGWSALVGLLSLVLLSPIPGFIAKKTENAEGTKMKKTDGRVQTITETISVIRMIKLFGWEGKMSQRVTDKREEELRWIWKVKVLRLMSGVLNFFIPTMAMIVTYAAYTVIMKQDLTASKIFSSMAVFFILRDQIHRVSWELVLLIQAKVSLDRLDRFLHDTEVLDRYVASDKTASIPLDLPAQGLHPGENRIGFSNAAFAWSADDVDGSLTPSSRNFRLRIEDELFFRRNCINMIVGPTGSGKTSILMALLGEMHFVPSQANSWHNLPRDGGVAYAAQESWVQSSTIRENIVFGSLYDETRYKKVIKQCALEHDLELFDAGDQTEVGERGLTLSGGQKARVTLARAIYSTAEIILLDDVLAALDVHTSSWIVEKCFRGDLVKGRTVVIVTHNIALLGPVAGFVVSLDADGTIKSQGTEVNNIIQQDSHLTAELEQDKNAIASSKTDEGADELAQPPKSSDGKLVVAEEISQGHVTWKSMSLLISAMGGGHPMLFFAIWIFAEVASEMAFVGQSWFLGIWGHQYEIHAPSDVRLTYYLSILTAIIIAAIAIYGAANIFFNYRAIAASKVIHRQLVESVFTSTFRWLDETPTARIIARCTQDVRSIDGPLPQNFYWVVNQSTGVFVRLCAVVIVTPMFLVPGIFVALTGAVLGSVYLRAQLSLKRELSNARSPLLAHFNASIHGLVSVRAYGAQKAFKQESLKRIDQYSRIARTSWNVNRWVGVRMEFLGAFFTAALAWYQVYGQKVSASNIGFSLNMAMAFCSFIFWTIRVFNALEVEANSLERVQHYLDIEHEPKATETGKPPAAWPTSGDLRVENLSARYSKSGPKVLHDISFHIRSGERVGIVGRTGSGKSSLTLALLRCIITDGSVYFDGLRTDDVNLDALRSSITIIPQMPELISGTLRQNLDPFDQNDDSTLNDALRSAGLFSLQQELGESRLTLDSKISGGGGNLSVGQRQIIALARAMVRGSKLLILDEATSAIDYKTDAVIQSTLRHELSADVTVITIAHRLQTIMDADKIMVLDNGRIAEFDSPQVLLRKSQGVLRSLVDESGDKDALFELARA